MARQRPDVMRDTQEFEAMRDALRRAVAPDERSFPSVRERSSRGARMQCPAHGLVEVLDRDERYPIILLVTVNGAVKTSRCGEQRTLEEKFSGLDRPARYRRS